MIAHMVYFSLKDNSPAAKEKLVTACRKYLSKHPGEVFFAAGTLAREFDRPVNDRDFDVALHLVFRDRAAHDKYQDAPRHKQFIDENKDNWKKVRVFDSAVQQ
ncbi:MAG: Dabb family protein [Gemmataceae bacterium]|nr:Dabb family protein [Gemmataceae bacterium]